MPEDGHTAQPLSAQFQYYWSALPINNTSTKEPTDYYEVHAIKVTSRDGRAPLTGDVITRAQNQFNQTSGEAYVSMDMDAEAPRSGPGLPGKMLARSLPW
jgi:SecD/SecF fusion protein